MMESQPREETKLKEPGRGRRKWLRWLALPAAAAVLALVYYLTRPPELVWWRSPPLSGTSHRIKILTPRGWGLTSSLYSGQEWPFAIEPKDSRPGPIRWLFPYHPEDGHEIISIIAFTNGVGRYGGEDVAREQIPKSYGIASC